MPEKNRPNPGPRFGPGAPADLIGTGEACEILHCEPSTLYRYVRNGALPHWRRLGLNGGRNCTIFVSRADCERLMRPGAAAPPASPSANSECVAAAVLRDAGLLPR